MHIWQKEELNIPIKSIATRNICNGFIELLIFPYVARYDSMKAIINPFKQSWAYIELLCRAHTYSNKKINKNLISATIILTALTPS